MITDYIIIAALLIIAGLGYIGDKKCYKDFRGFRYGNLVISYAIPVEAVGISSVLVFVLSVESLARTIWIITCVLALIALVLETWKVRA